MLSEAPITREITQLLRRWKDGDREILSRLVSLAYDDLHAIAEDYLRRERATHSLQATALVSELYLRLAQVKGPQISDRRDFFTFAAQVMRLILVDHARRSRAQKRPGSGARVPLHEEFARIDAADEELLALHTALDELEALDERKVRVLELRYFLGCTNEEAAELLRVSHATIERDLTFAKVWLYNRLTR